MTLLYAATFNSSLDRLTAADVRAALGALLESIARAFPASGLPAPLEELAMHARRAAPAWPALLTATGPSTDRRGSILSSPLFTSAEYPWPAAEGRWMEPVLQVNLGALGSLRNIPFGDGWLQLWMTASDWLLREVPAEEVANAALAALPSLEQVAYHCRLRPPEDTATPAWLDDGRSICGFGEPFFDYGHNELRGWVDWLLDEAPCEVPGDVRTALTGLGEAIDADGFSYRLVQRAFGMVNESDLQAHSVPPVLFVLEEGDPLRDSANGNDGMYVCYDFDGEGKPSFSLHGGHL